MSDNLVLDQQKIKRAVAKRACLNCRNKKVKCDGEIVVFLEGKNQCSNCLFSNMDGCIFLPSKRGGRKAKSKNEDKKSMRSVSDRQNSSYSVDKTRHIDNKTFKENGMPQNAVHNKQSPCVLNKAMPYQQFYAQCTSNNMNAMNQVPAHVQHPEYMQQQIVPPMGYNNMAPMYSQMQPSMFQSYQVKNMAYNAVPNQYFINPDNRNVQYIPATAMTENFNRKAFSNTPLENTVPKREHTPGSHSVGPICQLPSIPNTLPGSQPSYWNAPTNMVHPMPQQGIFPNSRLQNKIPQEPRMSSDVLTPINNLRFATNDNSANSRTRFSSTTLTPQSISFLSQNDKSDVDFMNKEIVRKSSAKKADQLQHAK